eukprot:484773-Rhodomonas_salina.2
MAIQTWFRDWCRHVSTGSACVVLTFCTGGPALVQAGLKPQAVGRLIADTFAEMALCHGHVHGDPHAGARRTQRRNALGTVQFVPGMWLCAFDLAPCFFFFFCGLSHTDSVGEGIMQQYAVLHTGYTLCAELTRHDPTATTAAVTTRKHLYPSARRPSYARAGTA